jgi:hypothetical protein
LLQRDTGGRAGSIRGGLLAAGIAVVSSKVGASCQDRREAPPNQVDRL